MRTLSRAQLQAEPGGERGRARRDAHLSGETPIVCPQRLHRVLLWVGLGYIAALDRDSCSSASILQAPAI